MNQKFYGMHWMLATPFNADESVDYASIQKLLSHAIESRCTGVVGLGVMGEVSKLTDRERNEITKAIISNAGNMPVTIGTTGNSTKVAIERSQEAEQLGAKAVMISAPAMPKSNLEFLFKHYLDISRSISIPIVMQDYPQVSGVTMPIEFITKVANEIPLVKYLKLEDPPTPTKISAIINKTGGKIEIFGGLGGVFLLDELKRGSIGAMTGFAYPEILVEICSKMTSNVKEAEKIFYQYLPLIQFEQQEGIGLSIRKYGLYNRNFISCPHVRLPGSSINKQTSEDLISLIKMVGLG